MAAKADAPVPVVTDDHEWLAAHFATNPGRRLYESGDLDPLFLPSVEFIQSANADAAACVFQPVDPPCLLVMGDTDADARLAASLHRALPLRRYYAHLSEPCETGLRSAGWRVTNTDPMWRMVLPDARPVAEPDPSIGVRFLGREEAPRLQAFLDRVYDGHSFIPAMVDHCPFAVAEVDGELASVAGTHIYAPTARIAALGNIATDPAFRGRGLASAVIRRLLLHLRAAGISPIGLNVRQRNTGAVSVYERLGFEIACPFTEAFIERD